MPKKSLSSLNEVINRFNKTMGDGVIHTASTLPNCRNGFPTLVEDRHGR